MKNNNCKNLILILGFIITTVLILRTATYFYKDYKKSCINSNDQCGYKLISNYDTLQTIKFTNDDSKTKNIRKILNNYIISSDFDQTRNLVIAVLISERQGSTELGSVIFENPQNGFITIDLLTYKQNDVEKLKCDMIQQIKTCSHSVFLIKNIRALQNTTILLAFFEVFNNDCFKCGEDETCIKGQIFIIDVRITDVENEQMKDISKSDLRKFLETILGESVKKDFIGRISNVI